MDHHVHIPVQTHRHVTVEKRMQRTAMHGRLGPWRWAGGSVGVQKLDAVHLVISFFLFVLLFVVIILILIISTSPSSSSSSSSSSVCTWQLCRIYFMYIFMRQDRRKFVLRRWHVYIATVHSLCSVMGSSKSRVNGSELKANLVSYVRQQFSFVTHLSCLLAWGIVV